MLSTRTPPHSTSTDRSDNLRTATIRALNDDFRQSIPRPRDGCRLIVTDGVAALGPGEVARILLAVRTHGDFGPDSDPHGEHDFGIIERDGGRFYWKIDCYDQWMQFGSSTYEFK
ncbi:DUF3768 domain-containing protein [Rhodopseudomonas sp. P2A-2r]|uniref:DUF3768 domain-containing protein n=1 Tax=Rhodopseudomonas sp. P2A-2r TaxID=2991972 RepID=UPI0039B6EE98